MKGYLAYVLQETSRIAFLCLFPPKFERVLAHHVTYQYGVEMPSQLQKIGGHTIRPIEYFCDDKIEVIRVSVEREVYQKDRHKFLHVTLSLDPLKKVKPVDANKLIIPGRGIALKNDVVFFSSFHFLSFDGKIQK